MPFLQIGSLTAFDIQTQGASEHTRQDRRAASEGTPTYAGGIRRQGAARKREWAFTSAPLARADYDALITAAYVSAAYQHCTGSALPAGGVDCIVTIEDGVYVDDASDANEYKMIAVILLREK